MKRGACAKRKVVKPVQHRLLVVTTPVPLGNVACILRRRVSARGIAIGSVGLLWVTMVAAGPLPMVGETCLRHRGDRKEARCAE